MYHFRVCKDPLSTVDACEANVRPRRIRNVQVKFVGTENLRYNP